MGHRVNQTTIPSYNTENSVISNMINNTILFCQEYIGERRNFIVVDAAALIANGTNTTVQTAFDNSWIVDFPNSVANGYDEKYEFGFLGSDYYQNETGFSFGKLLIKDKSKFKVFKDNVEIPQANFDFHPSYPVANKWTDDYTSVIKISPHPLPAEVYRIEYTENIRLGASYQIKLFRSDGQSLKPFMMSKTLSTDDGGGGNVKHYFARTIDNEGDAFTWTVHYEDFLTGNLEKKEKRHPDSFRLSEFAPGFDLSNLNLKLEIFKKQKGWNSSASGNYRSTYANTILCDSIEKNNISLRSFGGSRDGNATTGNVYMFRLRNTLTNEVSAMFDTKLSIKYFPVIQTNAALSLNDCVGYCQTCKLI